MLPVLDEVEEVATRRNKRGHLKLVQAVPGSAQTQPTFLLFALVDILLQLVTLLTHEAQLVQ